MPHFIADDDDDDVAFEVNHRKLSPRKSPSRQSMNGHRSTSSSRGTSSLTVIDDDTANGRHHSLAHELAVALMPEPSAGSRLLAEEFGIEFDEGAEGIDDTHIAHQENDVQIIIQEPKTLFFADNLSAEMSNVPYNDEYLDLEEISHPYDPVFGSPSMAQQQKKQKAPEQDAMELLAQNLLFTDKFLEHLRKLDVDSNSSVPQQPSLERIASNVIRRINESVRDREGQVRELLEYEREFRKIAGEVGGSEVLGQLDQLEPMEIPLEATSPTVPQTTTNRMLDIVEEEPTSPLPHNLSHSHDWELDPDRHRLGDDEDEETAIASPVKDSFPPPPTLDGFISPAKAIPQLTHLRSFTTSLVTSLTTISEQAQVNGAATTEAGRKIRALKNKLGGWRTEWESAERSRLKIDRWETGITELEVVDGTEINATSSPLRLGTSKRVDGRQMVQEQLHAFELALADAALKTQAIMAR